MLIIGHRGARGLAPENTLAAIKEGIAAGADAIEFDVRLTKDKHLILLHDPDLLRVAGQRLLVQNLTLKELATIATKSGDPVATLEQALAVADSTPLIIEGKGSGWARPLVRALKDHKGQVLAVISKNHEELYRFSCRRTDLQTLAITVTDPLEPLRSAKKYGFSGIDMNFWLMNPLIYWWARRLGLQVIVYTVNSRLLLRFIKALYPGIAAITTDYPNRFKQ